jgi:tetratricopeptide (TPR) repeat protein
MENDLNQPEHKEALCGNCQKRKPIEGDASSLCQECRTYFINFPIPKWLYIAMGAVLFLTLGVLVSVPKHLTAAMHIGRGEKAIENHRYLTASREFLLAQEQLPNSLVVNANLLIASAYLVDIPRFQKCYAALLNKQIDDDGLYKKSMDAENYLGSFFPSDSLYTNKIYLAGDSASLLDSIWVAHKKENAMDLGSDMLIADKLFDLEEYGRCEKILKEIEKERSSYSPALIMLAALKRNTNQYEEALAYCDKQLAINAEDVSTIAQKARIELKRHHDAKAAEYTEMALQLDPNNIYGLEAKALTQHYAKDTKGYTTTMSAIKLLEKEGDQPITTRITDIVTGKTTFR